MAAGIDMRIFWNDDDPELVTGAIIMPVSKAAKIWLSWFDEMLGLSGVSFHRRGGRSVGAYYIDKGWKDELVKTLQHAGWKLMVEE